MGYHADASDDCYYVLDGPGGVVMTMPVPSPDEALQVCPRGDRWCIKKFYIIKSYGKLNIDEVMALQMSGMPTSQIIKTDLAKFGPSV